MILKVDENRGSPSPVRSRVMTTEELQTEATQNLGETPQKRKKGLRELRDWVRNEGSRLSCLKGFSNEFYVKFLRMQKTDSKKASEVLNNYVRMRTSNPAWFKDLDIRDERLNDLISSGYVFVLPQRDAEGRRVIFTRSSAIDPSKFTAHDAMRAHMLTYEALALDEETQINGVTYLFDEVNLGWSHVAMWSPSEVGKALGCAEKAIPVRHSAVHVINLPWTLTIVYRFTRSLISEKMRDRLNNHSSLKDLAKMFPADILPSDLGGDVPLETMISDWKKVLEQKRDAILELDNIRFHGLEDFEPPVAKTCFEECRELGEELSEVALQS